MKYALIINRDDVLLTKPLHLFLEGIQEKISVIFYTDQFPPQSNKWKYIWTSMQIATISYQIKYLWTAIKLQIWSLPFMPKRNLNLSSIPNVCKKHNIPCFHIRNVNEIELASHIIAEHVDILISMTSQIYKSSIIKNPAFEIYNIHPSILPNNKGRFPIFWAIIKGDQQGISCHRIEEKIDAGEIIHQQTLTVNKAIRVEEIMDKLMERIPLFIGDCIKILDKEKEGNIEYEVESFYGRHPTKVDIERYRKRLQEKRR